MKRLLIPLILLLSFITGTAAAEGTEGPTQTFEPEKLECELEQELKRQAANADLSAWEEYFPSFKELAGGAGSLEELLVKYAEEGVSGSAEGLLSIIGYIVKAELKGSVGLIAALVASALLTGLAGVVSDEGIKPALSAALCISAVTLTTGVLVTLLKTACQAVAEESRLMQSSLPIMSGLLAAIGSGAAEGAFSPLVTFLSGTVVLIIERAVLPVVMAGGVLSVADVLTEGNKLEGLIKLAHSITGWVLGLLSAVYFSITAINGISMAMRDGVTVRTAKYAISRLVPVVGTMVSGTVDSVMGCALLIKNGAGILAVVILLSVVIKPVAVLLTGSFVFRAAAAISAPAADPKTVKLFSNAADMVSDMFACAAAAGSMFIMTILVFIAAGGVTAGLW